MLSRPWWAGIGVIVGVLIALFGYLLSSSSSSSTSVVNNTVHGNCSIAGNNNTQTCTTPNLKATP